MLRSGDNRYIELLTCQKELIKTSRHPYKVVDEAIRCAYFFLLSVISFLHDPAGNAFIHSFMLGTFFAHLFRVTGGAPPPHIVATAGPGARHREKKRKSRIV